MQKKVLALSAVLALLAAPAMAQYIPPTVPTIGTADLFADAVGGAATVQTQWATPAQIAGVPGYTYAVATTGFSYTFANSQMNMTINPAGTLATGTLTTAANPSDGQVECFFSTQTQTALTWTANTGQSIANAITAATANTRYCYQYAKSLATWERIQ